MGVDIVEKNFKTINEQVEILKNKGLIIEHENVVKDTLLRENYFFLMGYRHAFLISQKERKFIPGTTFNEIYSLFTFDRNFRNIIFKNVLVIENQLKSIRDKLVEIEVNETGFRALTRFGTIITNGEQSAVRAVRL